MRDVALSMAASQSDSIVGRKVAVLVADGVDAASIDALRQALEAGGASVKIVAPRLGELKRLAGSTVTVDHSLPTVSSVLFDAVLVSGGAAIASALCEDANAVLFVKEAYKHGKAIAAIGDGAKLVATAARSADCVNGEFVGPGVVAIKGNTVTAAFVKSFIQSVAAHRYPERKDLAAIIA